MDIQRVQQSKDSNCFDACIEMLTGIDQDLFDPAWTAPVFSLYDHATKKVKPGSWRWARADECKDNEVSIHGWRVFMHHLGFDLHLHYSQPDQPAIRIVNNGDHAVVQLPNGTYIDPASWEHIFGEFDMWLTFTPSKPMKPIRL